MKIKKSTKLTLTEIQNLKYFFSLIMEDYFGDKKELMEMANVDEDLLERFLMEDEIKNK